MSRIILWDLKCPFHVIPLLTDSNESAFAYCPECKCEYFKHELKDERARQAIIGKYGGINAI